MAQKVKPNTYRLGITQPWSSRWFYHKSQSFFLEEDEFMRKFITKRILQAGIASIEIERTTQMIRISIHAGRPGLIIGRGGKGIEELKDGLMKGMAALRTARGVPPKFALSLNIEELRRSDVSAQVTAQQIAFDLEKRQPYRRVMKRAIEAVMQNRDVKGVKVRLSGRLNGAEISRADWLAQGKMPLQTLRANIDYAEATAFNSYGTIGVKVWINKGEVFQKPAEPNNSRNA